MSFRPRLRPSLRVAVTLFFVGVAQFPASPRAARLWLSRVRRFVAPLPFALLCFGLNFAFAMLPAAHAQTNEWAWIGGSSLVGANGGQPGVYGTLGTPAAGNVPGSRFAPVSWTDASGNFWLFGGQGFDASGNYGNLNDLWEFNPSTKEWAWMAGSSTPSQTGVYGTLGTPAAGNVPGARYTSVSWTDGSGHLWLFGGGGFDGVSGDEGLLNDLWEFNPSISQWIWRGGSNTINQSGMYGAQGTPGAGNAPGGRDNTAVGWTDGSGDLWLFGGYGYDSTGTLGWLNDLWEFNPSTNQWTWWNGSIIANQLGAYGTLGTPATGNAPDARYGSVGWTDSSGDLWLFGGNGYEPDTTAGYLNDMWEFNIPSNEWTWKNGSSTYSQSGAYGTLGTPAAGNAPGGRNFGSSWTDKSGNFWLFGGFGDDSSTNQGYLNDLWQFDPSTNEWAWISGSSTLSCFSCSPSGVYGSLGFAAPGNTPGGRYGAVTWTDNSGNLWLFGGYGYDSTGLGGVLNDLWEYQPPAIAQVTPNPLNFGNLDYPGTVVQSITISNIGTATLTASPGAINGPSYTFVGNTCGAGVTAGNSCSISVQYSPVGVGLHNDYFYLNTNTTAGQIKIHLDGTAIGIAATVVRENFGIILFGQTKTEQLTITNYGVAGSPTISFAVNGPSYRVLPGSSCATLGVASGGSCTVQIEFDPVSVGLHDDHLTLTPSSGAAPSTVYLDGTAN